ncbi:Non-lysosomal glucosylceramidase [Morella rubra]|uniref:Non-lysosomal glucosylceramidase n=1 Tax=Morella rubra TaxID=262757 RepID=A0A6A1UMC9_9ROSI|nr:Non-lysosomal glucosylceramidase [Morella rubra]
MVTGNLFFSWKNSWPPEEYISRITLQLLDFDSAAPPEQAWRKRLNSHANILKEFSVTFMEAIKMLSPAQLFSILDFKVRLGIRLWSYVREEASHGRKAPIDPFSRESCKPSASQGVPLGAMGSGSISRGFRGDFRQWQIIPGICEASPVMANQFSVKLCPKLILYLLCAFCFQDIYYGYLLSTEVLFVSTYCGKVSDWRKAFQLDDTRNFLDIEVKVPITIRTRTLSGSVADLIRKIFISRDGGNKNFASVLAPGQHEGLGKAGDQGLSSWGWNLNGQHSTYHALFPRAWTVYDGEPDPELKISCRQISPFIPHNYRDSSLPTAVFVYTPVASVCIPMSFSSNGIFNPCANVVDVELVNTGRERAKVSLLFTWANSIGGLSHLSGDHVNEPFIGDDGVSGVLLHHKQIHVRVKFIHSPTLQHPTKKKKRFMCLNQSKTRTAKGNPPVTFSIAACETQNVNVTVLPSFGLSEGSCVTAKDMWGKMVQDGLFDRANFSSGPSIPSSPGETVCAAVSASTWVEPHGKCTVAFALAWSSPKIKFSKGSSYHRRYTKFYGTSERAALDLVHDALTNYKRWEEEIENWQNPILNDERLPEWYKFTLFNELYFLVAGGTVWIDSQSSPPNMRNDQHQLEDVENTDVKLTEAKVDGRQDSDFKHTSTGLTVKDDDVSRKCGCKDESAVLLKKGLGNHSVRRFTMLDSQDEGDDVGRFLYLEGMEYIMWCTYDVHFYASFALLELFPKIELSIQRDFAKAVLSEDGRKVKFLAEGNWGIRKVRGAIPHDLGTHDPWNEMNAYNIHDTSKWKDLNPKFVLQVYRDFAATGDMSFGVDVWPAVRAAMEHMEQFDRDNDGLIENDEFPDQTYDTWTVHGVNAYCGCLWLAALQAAAAMAVELGDRSFAERCKSKYLEAKPSFEGKLWNGSYFNYDSGSSSNSKSIQADQLAGQWYTASSGLPPLFDELKIRSSLQKIYDFNVMKVKGGRMGAVNGMLPNGKVDESCMQSREIWTGVTYGVAATMILAGMEEEAFKTAEGIFVAGWSEEGYGYWFQTPEGWTIDGHFRSLLYMRPLSIWGMQYALSLPKAILEAPKMNIMDRIHISPGSFKFSQNETGVRKIAQKAKCGCLKNSVFHCAC